VWGCGGVGCCRVGSLLTFDIPQTALVATLDTYDFFRYLVLWSAHSKMVRYVLLLPLRPELDGQDVEVLIVLSTYSTNKRTT
jgi:hypothetical protein